MLRKAVTAQRRATMRGTCHGRHRMKQSFFTATQVAQAAGIDTDRLQYWARTGALRPDICPGAQGSPQRWSERNLQEALVAARLRERVRPMAIVKRSIDCLRQTEDPFGPDRYLIVEGHANGQPYGSECKVRVGDSAAVVDIAISGQPFVALKLDIAATEGAPDALPAERARFEAAR